MIIISHRGYWLMPEEKNTAAAFSRSFDLMLGTETDVRDHCGDLVIAHDMPTGAEMTLTDFLGLINQPIPLALNIKADGLASLLKAQLRNYDTRHWFVFDMSIPDMRAHLACGNPVYARISEIEPEPVYYTGVRGIWLDAFHEDGWQLARIPSLLDDGKRVCLVSPELHRREHLAFWRALREQPYNNHPDLMLCTDFPEQAQQFFGIST